MIWEMSQILDQPQVPINIGWLQRLLEGRINQLKGTVTITKCAHRTFAAAQWQELKQQLAAWKVSAVHSLNIAYFCFVWAGSCTNKNCEAVTS